MTQARPWPSELTQITGRQVQRYRKEKGLTADQLAAEVTAAGLRYTRAQVTNLEAGRRDTATIGELLVFGHVLNVPPVVLVFPVGEVAELEVLPDDVRETWEALRWFTGEPPQTFSSREQLEAWRAASEPLRLNRQHQRLLDELRESDRREAQALGARVKNDATAAERTAAELVMDAAGRTTRQIEERLSDLRQQMRQQGVTPPPLSKGRDYLDRDVDMS